MTKEGESKYSWQEVFMELVNHEKEFKGFIDLVDRSVDRICKVSEGKTTIWKGINKIDLFLGFSLRIVVLGVLGLSLWMKVLSTEIFIILLGVVIGSLFGHTSKQ